MDNETKQMFELILAKFDKVDQRFDSIDKRFDSMDERLDGMDKRFDSMDGRLDGMGKRFDSMDGRLGSLENEFKEFRKETKEEHKLTDGKIDMIYNKLNTDIEEIKNKPEPKFRIVRE